MAHRFVHSHFEKFAQARLAFVRAVADCAERPEYMEPLLAEDVFTALRPMLHDKSATVASTAALAVGRIAGLSTALAYDVVKAGVLEDIVETVPGSHPSHMKAGAFVFRSLAKHNSELCDYAIQAGCLSVLVGCMSQLDVTVREAAAGALSILSSHTPHQAQTVAASGALPLLVTALQEPEPALKKAAATAIGEIATHAEELAHATAVAGCIPHMVKMLHHADTKIRKQGCNTLICIIKHSASLARAAIDAKLLSPVLLCMQDSDASLRRAAVCVVRDIVKHSEELCTVAVAAGTIHNVMEYMTTRARGGDRLPGTLSLGYIASFSELLGEQVGEAGGANALKDVLLEDGEDHLKAAAIWAIGQLGKHNAGLANRIASADLLRHIVDAVTDPAASQDLQDKGRKCLRAILAHCTHILALQNLLTVAPSEFIPLTLSQIAKVLTDSIEERRTFLASGGLKFVQTVDTSDGESGTWIDAINNNYPPEVVAFVKPNFMASVAERLIK